MCVIVKTRCVYSFAITLQSKLKNFNTLKTFTKSTLQQNLTKIFSSALLKNENKKAKLKKKIMQATFKLFEIAKGRRITLKKEKKKPKMRKSQTATINVSLTVTILCRKISTLEKM